MECNINFTSIHRRKTSALHNKTGQAVFYATALGMVYYMTYCPLTADNVAYKVKMNFNL